MAGLPKPEPCVPAEYINVDYFNVLF
jgi:hypothetical protein